MPYLMTKYHILFNNKLIDSSMTEIVDVTATDTRELDFD